MQNLKNSLKQADAEAASFWEHLGEETIAKDPRIWKILRAVEVFCAISQPLHFQQQLDGTRFTPFEAECGGGYRNIFQERVVWLVILKFGHQWFS